MRSRRVTHIIHEFNFARTNSEVVRNGTRLTVATVSASRRRGPDSPAAKISIWLGCQRELWRLRRGTYLYWRDATVVSDMQPLQKGRIDSVGSTQTREGIRVYRLLQGEGVMASSALPVSACLTRRNG
jgi:hypothetical protein